MTEVVINSCYGGFGLSKLAIEKLRERGVEWAKKIILDGEKCSNGRILKMTSDFYFEEYIPRNDPDLVSVVKELKEKSWGQYSAELKVVEIPDDVEWEIEEYDGKEWISEKHKIWK
jgi:hypothetical protein